MALSTLESTDTVAGVTPAVRPAQRASRDWFTVGSLIVTMLVLAGFFLWPLLDILLRSLNARGRVSWTGRDFSLTNYAQLVNDPALRHVMSNTLVVSAIATLVTLLLAFPTAYLMSRLKRKTAAALYLLILLPFWVSILVRLFAFTQILATNGPVNQAAGQLGLGPFELLFNTPATVIGMVNYLLPYMVLILYAGMAAVDPSLTLAAKTAGASGWQAFRRVFLPLIWPSIVGGTLLVLVIGLGFFLTPAILGGTGNITVSTYIATQVGNYQWGTASAVGIVLLVASVALFLVAIRVSGVGRLIGVASGGGKGVGRAEPLRAGPLAVVLWMAAGVAVLLLLVPLLIVIPTSFETQTIVGWPPKGFTVDWYAQVLSDPLWASAAGKSLRVGGLAMVLSVALGFAAARAMLRMRSKSARSVFTGLIYAPLVVPVILLAIGTFDTQAEIGLLGTSFGLAAAHAVIALPFTFTIFLIALSGFDQRLEQAAWSLGAARSTTLKRIVVPIILPSALGACLLAFVTSWDEATVAIFQSTGQSVTLPAAFFSQLRSGMQPTIAAIGTLLIAVVVVGGALYFLVGRVWRARRAHRLAREPIVR
jgi:putative spermidine/putrescine transport system permease protein